MISIFLFLIGAMRRGETRGDHCCGGAVDSCLRLSLLRTWLANAMGEAMLDYKDSLDVLFFCGVIDSHLFLCEK